MTTTNEFETMTIRLPAELAKRLKSQAAARRVGDEAFIELALTAAVTQAEADNETIERILHGKKTPEERAEFNRWVEDFHRRYDTAHRNLANE